MASATARIGLRTSSRSRKTGHASILAGLTLRLLEIFEHLAPGEAEPVLRVFAAYFPLSNRCTSGSRAGATFYSILPCTRASWPNFHNNTNNNTLYNQTINYTPYNTHLARTRFAGAHRLVSAVVSQSRKNRMLFDYLCEEVK